MAKEKPSPWEYRPPRSWPAPPSSSGEDFWKIVEDLDKKRLQNTGVSACARVMEQELKQRTRRLEELVIPPEELEKSDKKKPKERSGSKETK